MKKQILSFVLVIPILMLVTAQPVFATQYFTESSGTSWINLKNSSNNSGYLIHNAGDGSNLEFAAINTNGVITWQVMSINKGGNVGIRTNSPRSILDIAGDPVIGRPGGSLLRIQTPISDVRIYADGGKPILFPEGNVGIGTITPSYKLSVNGTIQAKEVLVNTGWSDFVFDKGYKLISLADVEKYINQNGHLPNIPSQSEIEKNGVSVGDMQKKQMAKIEELTLYAIQQDRKINELGSRLEKLESIVINK